MDRFSWRGLYALGLLLAGLLVLDAVAPVSQVGHGALLVVSLVVVFGLAFLWTEEHADLVQHEGVDSRLPGDDSLAAQPMLFIAGGKSIMIDPDRVSAATEPSSQPLAMAEDEGSRRSVQTPG